MRLVKLQTHEEHRGAASAFTIQECRFRAIFLAAVAITKNDVDAHERNHWVQAC